MSNLVLGVVSGATALALLVGCAPRDATPGGKPSPAPAVKGAASPAASPGASPAALAGASPVASPAAPGAAAQQQSPLAQPPIGVPPPSQAQVPPAVGQPQGQPGPSVQAILDSPQQFVGQTLTVTGVVAEGLGPRSFTLEGEDVFFDQDLLVVSANPLPPQVQNTPLQGQLALGSVVQVTGTVRQFNASEIQQAIGANVAANLQDFQGAPVLVAQQVNVLAPAIQAQRP